MFNANVLSLAKVWQSLNLVFFSFSDALILSRNPVFSFFLRLILIKKAHHSLQLERGDVGLIFNGRLKSCFLLLRRLLFRS